MHVLMIEDDEDDYILFSRYIAKIGDVEIEWRDSLKKGLAYLESHPVDILLLDMSLPDGYGLTTFDQVQTQFPTLPIIILSGNNTHELALEAVRHGAQDYLLKGQVNGELLGRSLRYALERKRIEEKLRQSDEMYRMVARNFPNGALVLYDHDLRYTLVEGLGLAELGVSKEALEGKTLWQVFPPEVATLAEPLLRSALMGELINQEFIYAGQTLEVSIFPVRDNNGIIICGMVMAQNITQRKQAEQEALRLQTALDMMIEGAQIIGYDWRYIYLNDSAATQGHSTKDELVGHTMMEMYPGVEQTPVFDIMQRCMDQRVSEHIENQFTFPDNTIGWYDLSIQPIPEGIFILSTDISRRKRTEESLRESEEQFRATFKYAAIGIALVGLDGRWLQVNPAVCEIVGYSEQELLTKTFQDITHPDDLESDLANVGQLLAGEIQSYHMEKRYFHKLGHEVWVLLSVSLVRDNQEQPLHFISQIQNITERKKVENALFANEEKLQTIFEMLPVGASLMNAEREVVQRNLALVKILDLSMDDLLKGKYKSRHYLHSDGTPMLPSEFPSERVIVEQQAIFDVEMGIIKEDGMTIWTSVSAAPLPHNQGAVIVTADITRRKQAEDKLTQERDILRALIDSSPDYIFVKDAQQRFVVSNIAHAQAANVTPDELVGKTAFDLFPADLAAQFHADDERLMQSGEPLINLERSTIGEHGESKTVLTTKIPLRDKNGQITSLVGISRDITERKQLEAQTTELTTERERVEILRRFINDMSHDFRTPLSIISTSLYLLLKNTDPQKQQVQVKKMEQQILRMDKLLDELLQMERLDEGEENFQFSLTEINPFLTPIIQEYEPIALTKQITCVFVPDTNPSFARIDTAEFARAIMNLMENAIAYTTEGGSITIRTRTEADQTIISVQDTGIGITDTDLPHVFERFYRADQARSTDTGGSGLGLSISQRIIDAHNGSIEVESTPGRGSIFSIRLPIG